MREFDVQGHYATEEERLELLGMMNTFVLKMGDIDKSKNILNGKTFQFPDWQIIAMLKEGVKDINSGTPRTDFTIFNFPDKDLIVSAAVIHALMAEGILQLRNNVDFSDSGFSVALFNKTGSYQNWAMFLLQMYTKEKAEFKTSIIPRSHNSGFFGVGSEFGYRTTGI